MSDRDLIAADEAPALPPLPDQSGLPMLLIHLGDDSKLAYKVAGQKGARWRGGFDTFSDAIEDAERDVPGHCVINFVSERD